MIGLKTMKEKMNEFLSGMIVRDNQYLICLQMIKTIGKARLFFVTESAKSSHVAKSQVRLDLKYHENNVAYEWPIYT